MRSTGAMASPRASCRFDAARRIYNGFLLGACAALAVPADVALAIDPARGARGAVAMT